MLSASPPSMRLTWIVLQGGSKAASCWPARIPARTAFTRVMHSAAAMTAFTHRSGWDEWPGRPVT